MKLVATFNVHEFQIGEWEKILILTVIFLFGLLSLWVRKAIKECRDERQELRQEVQKQDGKITALTVSVEKLKLQASLPCQLPECPKRVIIKPTTISE